VEGTSPTPGLKTQTKKAGKQLPCGQTFDLLWKARLEAKPLDKEFQDQINFQKEERVKTSSHNDGLGQQRADAQRYLRL